MLMHFWYRPGDNMLHPRCQLGKRIRIINLQDYGGLDVPAAMHPGTSEQSHSLLPWRREQSQAEGHNGHSITTTYYIYHI